MASKIKPEWPKRPDGSNKTFGEMTPAEQRAQVAASVARIKREIESPEMQALLAELPDAEA